MGKSRKSDYYRLELKGFDSKTDEPIYFLYLDNKLKLSDIKGKLLAENIVNLLRDEYADGIDYGLNSCCKYNR